MSKLEQQGKFNVDGINIASDLIKREIIIPLENGEFFDYLSTKINVDRIGEVVFAIKEGNKIWLVRQSDYPKGIYRIPSGGIGLNEPVLEALIREVQEELGIHIVSHRLIGFLDYTLKFKNKDFKFYSFVFLIERFTKDKHLITDGEISEILSVDIDKLNEYFSLMLKQEGFWGEWGKLRYYSSNVVFEYLSGQ